MHTAKNAVRRQNLACLTIQRKFIFRIYTRNILYTRHLCKASLSLSLHHSPSPSLSIHFADTRTRTGGDSTLACISVIHRAMP